MSKKKVAEGAAAPKKGRTGRFVGWQDSPRSQSVFGSTTKGGRNNTSFKVLKSTGSVSTVKPSWFLFDASKAPIGRLATSIATILMGKHRATFTPGKGCGDAVVVTNADKAFFTSNKAEKKTYYQHSRFMGGLKSETARQMLEQTPEKALWLAVQGMMPKTKLSRYQLSLLKIYKGQEHPHVAQNPVEVSLDKMMKKIAIAS